MAVNLQTVNESNARLASVQRPLVALFVGATSGIGRGAVEEFARQAVEPRVYLVARNAGAAGALVDGLRALNPRGRYEVIEQDVSLVRAAAAVAAYVQAREASLDLLFLSVGFVSLDGRQGASLLPPLRLYSWAQLTKPGLDTSEGLDASMTTRYYSRLRITEMLLPQLERAPSPHVVSILAGGQEGALREDDLALDRHWSVAAASGHSTTMGTLALERLAAAHPRVSFVHAFPGLVATPLLGRLTGGALAGPAIRYLVAPVLHLFARSAAEAGRRALFLATSPRYAVDGAGLLAPPPAAREEPRAARSRAGAGVFLVNAQGASVDSEKVLAPLRERGVGQRVWEHTQAVFHRLA